MTGVEAAGGFSESGGASVLVLALAGFHPGTPSFQANPIARFRIDRHDRLVTQAIARLDGTGRLERSRETVAMTLVV